MARQIYSHRFFSQAGFNGRLLVPHDDNNTWIIRDVDIYIGQGASSSKFSLIGDAGQTIWALPVGAFHEAQAHQWTGRQVLEAFESFTIEADDFFDVTISGYVLTP